ncbi:hypothetical protein TCAL_10411 [Tigriopus californicus]|uniref:Tyrosine specific protein phosphatases domain-containing protein n=2 Tax=Tigriopus californicus TaxID=6832 RepID=A0A553PK65_TIGCA|nr:hypothetical protein TCAL_10411 [Tigriopus californicus]|eukprot:TCALIF_10411-PA protein Name:"Similar to PTPDC1 Protein tyrosine phosphatase domain-containing protein 1 (Bos taurus)" AED:0.10 eAED:0.10 QI:0/-1/0/1/-1/1/1/0/754
MSSSSAQTPLRKGGLPAMDKIDDLVPAGLIHPRDNLHIVDPKYTRVGEGFRKTVPHEMQCAMFCGGLKCKYESGTKWKSHQQAIKGIYSHWITDNLLAMARPNTETMAQLKIIEQFKNHNIRSIINLQTPGEHASCGNKLEASGFTYDPNEFMKNDIYFYNFGWKDYGEAPMANLLDMVKVLSFALSEGNVAVHCHAGMGRTGVLISCYLVYFLRVRANDAIRFVRLKRPGAVQTRKQIECVKEFETYFLPQCLVFSNRPPNEPDKKLGRFSVEQSLKRQKLVIHGYEARTLKHIPKLIYTICERLLKLCNCKPLYHISENNFSRNFIAYRHDNKGNKLLNFKDSSGQNTPNDSIAITRRSSRSMMLSTDDEMSTGMPTPSSRPGSETNSYIQSCSSALSGLDDKKLDDYLGDGIHGQTLQDNMVTKELESHHGFQKVAKEEMLPKCNPDAVHEAFLANHAERIRAEGSNEWATEETLLFKRYRVDLNNRASAWDKLETETNLFVLTALLLEWLEHLKSPVLNKDGITYVVIRCDNIDAALRKLPIHVCYILEYIVRFVARLQPLKRSQSENLMKRFVAALTHQSLSIEGKTYPGGKGFQKLRGGTSESTMKFLMKLFDVLTHPGHMADHLENNFGLHSMAGGFSNLGASAASRSLNMSPPNAHYLSVSSSNNSMEVSSSHSVLQQGDDLDSADFQDPEKDTTSVVKVFDVVADIEVHKESDPNNIDLIREVVDSETAELDKLTEELHEESLFS